MESESKALPQLSPVLFWDVDKNTIDYEKHSRHIIEKVVTRGKLSDWQEAKRYYGIDRIKQEVVRSRAIDIRTCHFLSNVLDIPKEQFRCYIQGQLNPERWIF